MEKLLFTELIIEALKGNKEAYFEAYNRLKFCGFDEKTIQQIILCEKEIIQKRKLTFTKPLHKTFWWVNNLENLNEKTLFEKPIEQYFFSNMSDINEKTLSLGELISFYDEAYYISHFCQNAPSNILKETIQIAKYEDNRSWIVGEFYSRIELLYRIANKINNNNNRITDIHKIHAFYDNEVHIIMSYKWRELMNIPDSWEAYTDDYYNTI